MAGSTNKKVQIVRFDREAVPGFVNPTTYLSERGVEVLTLAGNVIVLPYEEIKAVHFVQEFDPPAVLERSKFNTRPKLDGLWVRMTFRDQDTLEAVLPNNLLHLEPFGFTVIPPDFSYSNKRLFVPKPALNEMQVLGVVGSPLRRKPKASDKDQITLFES